MPAYESRLWTLEIISLLSGPEIYSVVLNSFGKTCLNGYKLYSRHYSMKETTESFDLGSAERVRGCGTIRGLKSLNNPI